MITLNIRIKGVEEVIQDFRGLPSVIAAAMADARGKIQTILEKETPFGRTGVLRGSWSGAFVDRAGSILFTNSAPYAFVPEEGRYKGVGPRTVKTGSGIFSSQAPKGITSAVTENPDTVDDIFDGVIEDIMDGVYRG